MTTRSDISHQHCRFLALNCDHIERVRRVLSLQRDARFTLKLKECNSFTCAIDDHGHVMRPRRLKIATLTTNAMERLNPLTNITKLRSSLKRISTFSEALCLASHTWQPHIIRIWTKDQPAHFRVLSANKQGAIHEQQNKLVSLPKLALIATTL